MLVLFTLASGQFLMTLDSSVMNVSIATVAKDVGTTVTGIQGAITAYTLVMASLMITGAKIGAIIGRKRAFAIGCIIYGCGSFTTSIAPSLPVLLFGWSFLEGVGAALILPAIVALVAGNFPAERRPAAYGLVAAAGAIAVAVGPLIGGFFTTYYSWRWVFAGEVIVVAVILLLTRRIADAPAETRPKLDIVGAVLSAAGLALIVLGVLRSSEWGWINPKPDGPSWAGISPTVWCVLAGLFVVWLFFRWQARRESRGEEPLVRPGLLANKQLSGGLLMFFFQYLVQAGFFFVVPLYLSVCLGLSAIDTGVRLLPLSVTLLISAIGIPRFLPHVSPRPVVRAGLLSLFAGTVVMMGGLDVGSGPEVGGIQNTMTNLGASMGTALAGSIMITAVAAAFLVNVQQSPAFPPEVKQEAGVELASGVPFVSDADLENALEEAGATSAGTDAAIEAYSEARLDGLRSALAILAVLAIVALLYAQRIPKTQPAAAKST